MKRNSPLCRAGDCPSLEGGPVSVSHEGRMTPPGAHMKSDVKNDAVSATNGVRQIKRKNTEESMR